MKKTIFHIIDSLAIGGAEQLLVGMMPSLEDFNNIIVTLNSTNQFKRKLKDIEIISLEHNKKSDILASIFRLRKLIKTYQPSIVHTHLYWSTIIGRFACLDKKNIQLVTTYHSLLYDVENTAQYSKKMLRLDKLTYNERFHTIYISEKVKAVISNALSIDSNHYVIYNYVEDNYYQKPDNHHSVTLPIKAVAVGNLRPEKDYTTVVSGVGSFSKEEIQLDIYGDGKLRSSLDEQINNGQIKNVYLKGHCNVLHEVLPQYHLFIMGSKFEGFGIALVEAMALGLPCLVSDIETFQEIGKNKVFYFKVGNKSDLIQQLKSIIKKPNILEVSAQKVKEEAKKFSKANYVQRLVNIYNNA